jgi:hypothetical protein
MRFLLVLLVWVVFVGGVTVYVMKRETVQSVDERKREEARSAFALELTTSFDVTPDPFALETKESTGIVVRAGGRAIAQRDELEAGTTLRIAPIPGLIQGSNEFYIEANPPLDESNRPHALQIRILRGDVLVVERILWAEPGSRVASTFVLDTTEADHEESKHDH